MAQDNWEQRNVTLKKGANGLGFTIFGRNFLFNTEPVVISNITPMGSADLEGSLRIGDIITHVNNICVTEATHSFTTEILKRTGDIVHLTVKRRHIDETNGSLVEVELLRTHQGLGLSICGGVNTPSTPGYTDIYVSRITDGGAAHRDGGLGVGDRLVCIRNLPPGELPSGDFWLSGVTHEEADQTLRQSGASATLLVRKLQDQSRFI